MIATERKILETQDFIALLKDKRTEALDANLVEEATVINDRIAAEERILESLQEQAKPMPGNPQIF